MRTASLLATLLLLAAGGCSDAPAPPIPTPPPAAATGLAALSEEGRQAYRVLRKAGSFASGVPAKGGGVPVEVEAFRVLLREKPAAAKTAFEDLRGQGEAACRLYGLCGAWFTDRPAFEAGCRELALRPESETVRYESGCETFETEPVAGLVRSRVLRACDIESGALPMRLGGRGER